MSKKNNVKKKKIESKRIPFSEILSLISILVGLHYFFSYQLINGLLKVYGISHLPLISFEDLTFPTAQLNLTLAGWSQFGLIWIIIWLIFLPNIKWKKTVIAFRDFPSDLRAKLNKSTKQKKVLLWSLLTLCSLITVFCLVILISKSVPFFSNLRDIVLYLICFVTPFIYVFGKKKRILTLAIHITMSLIWMNMTTNHILDVHKQKDYKNVSKIQFHSEGNLIQTSDSLYYVFHGSDYVILSNPTKDKIQVYRTDAITHFEFSRKK